MVFQEIHYAVGQHHSKVDIWIGLEELHRDREHVQATKDDRCGDDKVAFRGAVFPGRGPLGFSHVLKNAAAGRDIRSARVGQRDLPTRPGEKPRLEVRLELRDLAADGRERCVEPARRRRRALRFDGHQDRHQFKAIHRCGQKWGEIYRIIYSIF